MSTVRKFIPRTGLFGLCMIGMMTFGATASYGQTTTKELIKARREIAKESRAQLNDRATKAARKEAKQLAKEGWLVAPGALPLEKQLDKMYLMRMEIDESMYPKYIVGDAMSVGENYDAAKIQALELAKLNLAEQIQTEVTALVDQSVANQQLPEEDAASVTKTLMESKSLISQSIGRTMVVMECYRTIESKRKMVRICVAYNGAMAKSVAKKAIRQSLEKEGKELGSKLDELLGGN